MKGVCCIYDEPNCIIDMFLQPPWLPNYAPIQAPPNWQPVVYDSKQISMPIRIDNPELSQVQSELGNSNLPKLSGPPLGYGTMGSQETHPSTLPPSYSVPNNLEESKSEVD